MKQTVYSPSLVELERYRKIIEGNDLKSILDTKDRLSIELTRLQKLLDTLRREENITKGRIYNNLDAAEATLDSPDFQMTQEPIQASQYIEIGYPDLDNAITYDMGRLLNVPGMVEILKKLHEIDFKIRKVQSYIEDTKSLLSTTMIKLNDLKKKNITEASIKKQKIASRENYYIRFLYCLHLYYRQNTEIDGQRLFPEDLKIIRALLTVREIFRAHVQALPQFLEDNPDYKSKLDLDDIGSDRNGEILRSFIAATHIVGQSEKVEQKVKEYVDSLTTSLNNPYLSNNLSKKPPQDFGFTLYESSKTYPIGRKVAIAKIGNLFWDLPIANSMKNAVEKVFRKKVKKNYIGRSYDVYLPPCPNALPDPNENDIDQASNDAIELASNEVAALEYRTDLVEAIVEVNSVDKPKRLIGALNLAESEAFFDLCEKISCNPEALYRLIQAESGWDPYAKNPIKGQSAKGLIQFINATARDLGYASSEDLVNKNPTIEEQLRGPVLEFFQFWQRDKGLSSYNTDEDLFMTVFRPSYVGLDPRTEFPAHVRKVNPNINTPRDYINSIYKKSKNVKIQYI